LRKLKLATIVSALPLLLGCSTLGWLDTHEDDVGCASDSKTLCIEISKDSKQVQAELEAMMIRHEGYRRHPYTDRGTTAIGYGRNLTNNGITEDEALHLLRQDIDRITQHLETTYPVFDRLTNPRRAVLISMTYMLGEKGISEFAYMWENLEKADYNRAALEIYLSRMCGQIGNRCGELAKIMETGEYENNS